MKELKVYKYIRKKPKIYGFTPQSFYIFIGGSLAIMLILITGITLIKLLIVGLGIFINLLITRLYLSNENLIRKISDERFPNEISSLTKTKR